MLLMLLKHCWQWEGFPPLPRSPQEELRSSWTMLKQKAPAWQGKRLAPGNILVRTHETISHVPCSLCGFPVLVPFSSPPDLLCQGRAQSSWWEDCMGQGLFSAVHNSGIFSKQSETSS